MSARCSAMRGRSEALIAVADALRNSRRMGRSSCESETATPGSASAASSPMRRS